MKKDASKEQFWREAIAGAGSSGQSALAYCPRSMFARYPFPAGWSGRNGRLCRHMQTAGPRSPAPAPRHLCFSSQPAVLRQRVC